jgi:hypothetical protein
MASVVSEVWVMEMDEELLFGPCARCADMALIPGHCVIGFDGEEHRLCSACYSDLHDWFRRSDGIAYVGELAS